jgi:hypothetical protein
MAPGRRCHARSARRRCQVEPGRAADRQCARSTGDGCRRDRQLLVEQVTGQVRWRETVEWFAANGVTTLYELGSGKVLTGLARRIDKTSTASPSTRRPISTRPLPRFWPD